LTHSYNVLVYKSVHNSPHYRDHRSVFVGDAKGRVFSWSMAEGSGPADHWIKDEEQDSCTQCDSKFTTTTTNRRHHCRNCGQLFCAKSV